MRAMNRHHRRQVGRAAFCIDGLARARSGVGSGGGTGLAVPPSPVEPGLGSNSYEPRGSRWLQRTLDQQRRRLRGTATLVFS